MKVRRPSAEAGRGVASASIDSITANPAVRQGQKAFSLVEVLVGVGFVAVVAVSLFAAFASGFATVGMTREDLRATQIMMRKLEGIRLCSWSELTNQVSFFEPYDPAGGKTNQGAMYGGTLSVGGANGILGSASYTPNTRLVTVSIVWTNYSMGKPCIRHRQMQTLAARYGLQNYIYGQAQ